MIAESIVSRLDTLEDLIRSAHHWCEYCDEHVPGPAGIDFESAAEDAVDLIIWSNGLPAADRPAHGDLEELAEMVEASCPNCSAEWGPGLRVGSRWPPLDGGKKFELEMLTRAGWPYLTHYTKGAGTRGPVEILAQIVSDGEIKASKHLIKGSHLVVCFTEASPPEIDELIKGYAAGTGGPKWTRSRHGIAIRRTPLIERAGALPVVHGSEDLYDSLPADDKHRFVRFEHGSSFADWTFEREFRVSGSVGLKDYGPGDVVVVVESSYERTVLLALDTPPIWPVICFDDLSTTVKPYATMSPRQVRHAESLGWRFV